MGHPLISLMTPTFDCAALLPQAIQSVLAQTAPGVNAIMGDHGSREPSA